MSDIAFSFSPGLHRQKDFFEIVKNLKTTQPLALNYQLETKASDILHRKGLQALITYDFGIKRLQVGDYFKNKGIKKINNIINR